MTGATWTTTRQAAFLAERYHLYLAHKQAKPRNTLPSFWPGIISNFFCEWPDQDTEIAEENAEKAATSLKKSKAKSQRKLLFPHEVWAGTRTAQIKSFFSNRYTKAKSATVRVDLTIGPPAIIRRRSEEQTYSKLFYHSRCKAAVEAYLEEKKVPLQEHVAQRARITHEMYQSESEEIKKAVMEEMERVEEKRKATKTALEGIESGTGSVENRNPMEYAQVVRVLPEILKTVIPRLAAASGWSWTIIGGGPDPDKVNGGIRTVAFQSGENSFGQLFDESEYEPLCKQFVTSYKKFCHSVHAEDQRLARAISVCASKVVDPKALPQSGRADGIMQFSQLRSGENEATATPKGKGPDDGEGGRDAQPGGGGGGGPDVGSSGSAHVPESRPFPPGSAPTDADAFKKMRDELEAKLRAELRVEMEARSKDKTGATGGQSMEKEQHVVDDDDDRPAEPVFKPSFGNAFKTHPSSYGFGLDDRDDESRGGIHGNLSSTYMNKGMGPWHDLPPNGTVQLPPPPEPTPSPRGLRLPPPGTPREWSPFRTNDDNGDGMDDQLPEPHAGRGGGGENPGYEGGRVGAEGESAGDEGGRVGNEGESAGGGEKPGDEGGGAGGGESAGGGEKPGINPPKTVPQRRKRLEMEALALGAPTGAEPRVKRARRLNRAVPEWIEEAKTYLVSNITAEEWLGLVEVWYQFECGTTSEDTSSRLGGALFRPKLLSKWFSSKPRAYGGPSMPVVENVDEFAREWTVWWNEMQPKVRKGVGLDAFPPPVTSSTANAVVHALQKNGPAGISVLLVGLKWWAPGRSGRGSAWQAAVADVASCLRLFVDT